ncbi:hypothetical protein N0V82_004098 [Gnomoniopsis sp. IMI 355080]|nr:hypothetical protein N0V82_004098 [Gnomoniopsis sp. IMI 355080]
MSSSFSLTDSPVGKYFANIAELSVLRIFMEYNIFAAIPAPPASISIQDLAGKLEKVDHKLLDRFSRMLIASGVLASPSSGHVALTPTSQSFLNPQASGFFTYLFDFFLGPSIQWPAYFDNLGSLQEPPLSRRCPGGFAFGAPDKTAYEIMSMIPQKSGTLNQAMALEGDVPAMPGGYQFNWVATHAASDSSRTLIVDVGGGKGQALKAILDSHPQIPARRCVLQDQAAVVHFAVQEHKDDVLGQVQIIGKSFFEQTPVQGALVYYLRRVLNDWSDEEATKILTNLRGSCAPDSRVLVVEYLRKDEPELVMSAVDMFILNIGGKVRSEVMFKDIASRAGLEVSSVTADMGVESGCAVIEMVPI